MDGDFPYFLEPPSNSITTVSESSDS